MIYRQNENNSRSALKHYHPDTPLDDGQRETISFFKLQLIIPTAMDLKATDDKMSGWAEIEIYSQARSATNKDTTHSALCANMASTPT